MTRQGIQLSNAVSILLSFLRFRSGLTLDQLAAQMHCGRNTLSRMKNKHTKLIRVDFICRYVEACGSSMAEFTWLLDEWFKAKEEMNVRTAPGTSGSNGMVGETNKGK